MKFKRGDKVRDRETGQFGKIRKVYWSHDGWGSERIKVRWDDGTIEDDLTKDLLDEVK